MYSLSFSSCSWQNDSCFLCNFSCSCFTSDWTRFLSSCSASNCITTSEKEKPVLNAGNTSFNFHCKQCVFSFHMCWNTTTATVLYYSCHCYHISFEKKRQMTEIRECTWNPHHDRIFLNHEHIKILYPYLLSTPCSYWMILRKTEDTKTLKRKHYIALCGQLAFREATDLSQHKLHNKWICWETCNTSTSISFPLLSLVYSHMIKWFAPNKLVLNLDKANIRIFVTNSALHIGYTEKYTEEMVNSKFLGLQSDKHLKWKNHKNKWFIS